MTKDEGAQHEASGEEAAEGQGGVQSDPSGPKAGNAKGGGETDGSTPERQMESGKGTVQSRHGENAPPGEGATKQQRDDAEETREG